MLLQHCHRFMAPALAVTVMVAVALCCCCCCGLLLLIHHVCEAHTMSNHPPPRFTPICRLVCSSHPHHIAFHLSEASLCLCAILPCRREDLESAPPAASPPCSDDDEEYRPFPPFHSIVVCAGAQALLIPETAPLLSSIAPVRGHVLHLAPPRVAAAGGHDR